MIHVDLFSGIGGFALAARWMGWETVQFCEREPFAREVLKKNFPGVPISHDIFDLRLNEFNQKTIVTGGFPCQPFSQAGERRGMSDTRAIWPEMHRIVREVRPTYVVAENVSGILTISKGLVFEHVCADLESEGYEVQPVIIPAACVGAYHQRERVWFVAVRSDYATNTFRYDDSRPVTGGSSETAGVPAVDRKDNSSTGESGRTDRGDRTGNGQEVNATHANSDGLRKRESGQDRCPESEAQSPENQRQRLRPVTGRSSTAVDAADTNSDGRIGRSIESGFKAHNAALWSGLQRKITGPGVLGFDTANAVYPDNIGLQERDTSTLTIGEALGAGRPNASRIEWPTEPAVRVAADGVSPGVVRIKDRTKQLKGLGNAIVPQVAYQIFRAIEEIDKQITTNKKRA